MGPDIAIVNQNDKVIGSSPRKAAVESGKIHRIVRIFVFNPAGELYLQKRPGSMDVGRGKWDQSAGGHVDAGEEYEAAAHRETEEEIGLSGLALEDIVTYYEEFEHDVHGHLLKRFNRIYRTETDQEPKPNTDEVAGGKWMEMGKLDHWMTDKPEEFTQGFRSALRRYKEIKHA